MAVAMIIGASRGIGLELVRQYLAEDWRVHATTRTPHDPGTLGELAGDLVLHELDVCSADQIGGLVRAVSSESIDVFIHNAGVYGTGMSLDEVMRVNAEAPIAVTDALLDAVARSEAGKAVLMTSQMGSRGGRQSSLGLYGDSKAALNDRFRERSEEWGRLGIIAIVMHPGWVRTDMGGDRATLSVEESVRGIRRVVAQLTPADHGCFLTWDGREHPW